MQSYRGLDLIKDTPIRDPSQMVRAWIFNCSRLGGEDTLDVVRPTSLGRRVLWTSAVSNIQDMRGTLL